MRIILTSALAALATSLPVLSQSFGYEIDIDPPTGNNANNSIEGDWRAPGSLTWQVATDAVRLRILAPPGTWVRPLLDFELDPQLTSNPPEWLQNNAWLQSNVIPPSTVQGLSTEIAGVFGASPNQLLIQGYENVVIPRPHSFMRWLSFGVRNGTSAPVSSGVQQWFQPVLTTTPSNPHRLWTANAPLWGTGNGPVSSWIWSGVLNEKAAGNSTLSFYSCLRYALTEHAIFLGQPALASQLMNDPEWNSMISDVLLRLAIQAVGMKPPQSTGAATDPASDPLTLPDMPLTFVSPAWSFRVELPAPLHSQFYDLGNVTLLPGTWHTFRCPQGRVPMEVRFPTITNGVPGRTINQAVATPSLTDPSSYKVFVPTNYVSGALGVRHGDMTQWIDAATSTPLPN